MRIAVLLSGSGVNGVTAHCRGLIKFLCDRGHQILLVHRLSPWIEKQPEFRNVARFETSFALRPKEILEVGKQILRFDADVIHSHMSAAHAYGAFYRLFSSIPVVATAHAMHVQLHWLLNSFVIATSHEAENFHRRFNFVDKNRIATIPNFVDTEYFRPPNERERVEARSALSVSPEEFVVGFVGDLIDRKRPKDLLHAFAKLAQARNGVRLLVAGGPHKRVEALRELGHGLGVGKFVSAIGHCTNIRQAYWAMDLFAHPSGEETGPLAVLEAAAAGLPVVATDVGMVSSFVKDGISGFVIAVGDTEHMARRILEISSDRKQLIEFSLAARRQTEEVFSVSALAPQIEALFARLALRSKAHRRAILPPRQLWDHNRYLT